MPKHTKKWLKVVQITIKQKERPFEKGLSLEVQAGFEPADNGVADRGLTTWLLHQTFACHSIIAKFFRFVKGFFKFLTFYFACECLLI